MRRLDEQEKERRVAAKREAAQRLELGLDESRRKVRQFAESAEGQTFLRERALQYRALNHGMSEAAALLEARNDLDKASESTLRWKVDSTVSQRVQSDLQRIQLERLKVAWELIQLQRRCEGLLTAGVVTQACLQGFDLELVDRVTNEAWYLEAREAAAHKLGSGPPQRPPSPGSREVCPAKVGPSAA